MPVDFKLDNPMIMTWLLLHQTYNSITRCENKVFNQHGISTEQHAVLMAIKYIGGPVTATSIAKWLDRNKNTISLIVDRMVKAGLIRRASDLRDRRVLRLFITDKGKTILDEATVYGWALIQEILSKVSEEEMHTLMILLEKVKGTANEYLEPGRSVEVVRRNEARNMARFMKRVNKYFPESEADTGRESEGS